MDKKVRNLKSLSPAKRQLLLKRAYKARVQPDKTAQTIQPISREERLPLSFAQNRMWFLHQLNPESPAYNVPMVVRITGKLSIGVLRRALHTLMQRHETLRTTFHIVDGYPHQIIASEQSAVLPLIDLRESPASERDTVAYELVEKEVQRPFDLSQGPLLRTVLIWLEENEFILAVNMHHIISDAWSANIFVQEWTALYQAYLTATPSPLRPLPIQYVDFAHWQQQQLQRTVFAEQITYWQRQLAGAPADMLLPTDYPRPPVQTFCGAIEDFTVPNGRLQALKTLSQQEDATLFITCLAAFNALLYYYTGQTDLLVGTPITNRNHVELEGLIGFFVNTLVIRTDVSGTPSFRELLRRVRQTALAAYAHQDLPFEKLVEVLQQERDLSRSPLIQVLFIFQEITESATVVSDLHMQLIKVQTSSAKFDLTLNLTATTESLNGTIEYNTDLFAPETISRMANHLTLLLDSVATNPDQQLSTLSLLTSSERRQILHEWNNTWRGYPGEQCIHELFEARATLLPQASAVKFAGNSLTYQQLNQKANQLAHYLKSLGVGPETRIGICMERSLEMVIALLAILKAGGAYVPLDPAYPQRRLAYILADTQTQLLLTQKHLKTDLQHLAVTDDEAHQPQSSQVTFVCVDADWPGISQEKNVNLGTPVSSANLAYIIYTSGSTGQPKGVRIAHRSTVALLAWAANVYTAKHLHGVLAATSICFDLSIFELFLPLAQGGTVILAQDALSLATLPERDSVTLINTVPSVMVELLRSENLPVSVNTVNLAGEPLKRSLVQQIAAQPNVQQIYNLYGPSEDTTYSIFSLLDQNALTEPVIGRPISNTQAYILDPHMQPVPVGVVGELYLGGEGLGQGYLNQPRLTAEKFVPNPFCTDTLGRVRQDTRLYKTGDFARFLPDGNILFLGRTDYQVKVRGFRIELGAIEMYLKQHPAVQDAVALVHEAAVENKLIVAYVVPEPGEDANVSELRLYLKDFLPAYMIPTIFITLDAFPLTPNGKLNRHALPAPNQARPELETRYSPPQTDLERAIAQIWQEVLEVEKIGIHDNFFDLGGHSLLIVQVHHRLQTSLHLNLPIVALFKYPSVGALAAHLGQKQSEQIGLEQSLDRANRRQVSTQRQRRLRRNR